MFDEQLEAVRQALADFARAATEVMRNVAEALRPLFEAVMEQVRLVYQWLQKRYHDASAPYGDTDDGMLRWWREQLHLM